MRLPPDQRRLDGFPRYKSTKHLCRIDVHTLQAPPPAPRLRDVLFQDHPRARVWEEERDGALPTWFVRRSICALRKDESLGGDAAGSLTALLPSLTYFLSGGPLLAGQLAQCDPMRVRPWRRPDRLGVATAGVDHFFRVPCRGCCQG